LLLTPHRWREAKVPRPPLFFFVAVSISGGGAAPRKESEISGDFSFGRSMGGQELGALAAPPRLKERAMDLPVPNDDRKPSKPTTDLAVGDATPAREEPDPVDEEEEGEEEQEEEKEDAGEDPSSEESEDPPEAAPLPDYDGQHATNEEREQMVRDMSLRAELTRFFVSRVRPGDVDDFVQETVISAHSAPNLPSGGGKERDKYVVAIAKNKLVDRVRRDTRQVPIAEGADVDRAVQAVDAVADRDLFRKVTAVPESQMFELECLLRMGLGYKLKEIAREHGVEYKPLHKRVAKLRLELFKKSGALMAVLLLILTGREVLRRPAPMALDEPDVVMLEPAVSTHVTEADPMDWARVLRGRAFRDCVDNQWLECREGLDAARDLDPEAASRVSSPPPVAKPMCSCRWSTIRAPTSAAASRSMRRWLRGYWTTFERRVAPQRRPPSASRHSGLRTLHIPENRCHVFAQPDAEAQIAEVVP
jgi:DNA-directed RNA polymerase specialized sigma24 family protein